MTVAAIIKFLVTYRRQIAYGALAVIVFFAVRHYVIVNPRVMEEQRQALIEKDKQIEARDNSLNLLGTVFTKHAKIERDYEENLRRIRNGKKPSRTGIFVLGGVLPDLSETYSPANSDPSRDEPGGVRPGGPVLPD